MKRIKNIFKPLNPKRILNRFRYDSQSDHMILGVLTSGIYNFFFLFMIKKGISIGLGIAAKYVYDQLKYQKESIKWPTCQGIITSVYYIRNRPIISYEYVAFGKQFSNQKIDLKIVSTYLNLEKQIQFRPEGFVKVRYNIKNPQISCLIPSKKFDNLDLILFGVLCTSSIIFGGFGLSRFRKYLKPYFKSKKK